MESGLMQLWVLFKWILPAAIGSGLAVFIDSTESTFKRKFGLFLFGALVSILAGGACIEWFDIKGSAVQGFIYWAWGVWGMGIVIQITKQLPIIITNLRDKYTK